MSESAVTSANLFLVGAPKAGTTSVATWLAEHPDIFWSVPKEPQYWSRDFPGLRAHYGFAERSAYQALYAGPEAAQAAWRGDGSTTYLYSTHAVPDILAEQPDARFVVCLRRPDELIPSYHRTQLTALNETEPDLERAWRRCLEGLPPAGNPLDPKLVDYPLVGAIGAATARLAAAVPPEQVEFVVFDDLKADPLGVHRRILDFLDVDPSHQPDLVARNASSKAARFATLRRVTHRPPPWLAPTMARVRQWSRTSQLPAVRRIKGALWRKEARPQLSVEFAAELRAYFASDVAALESILGRRLDAWHEAGHEAGSGS